MSGLRPKESIRQLPPGKLQNLKKLFEERDKEACGATLYGIIPRVEEEEEGENPPKSTFSKSPSSITQPRILSSPHAPPAPSSRKMWLGPDFITTPTPVKVSKGQENTPALGSSHQRSSSEKACESPNTAAGQRVLSPRLSQRLTLFSDSGSNGVGELSRAGRLGSESRESSPAKCWSDSSSVSRDDAAVLRRYTPERQRAMSDGSYSQKPGEVSVLNRLKRFEEKPGDQARRPVTVLGQNMSSVSGAQRPVSKSNGQSENNSAGNGLALPERNFERLKVKIKFDTASPKPLLSPPSKPPRTFAHDEYLQTKIITAQNQNGRKEKQSESQNAVTVRSRVSALNNGADVKEEVVLRAGTSQDSYFYLAQSQTGRQGTPPRDLSSSQPLPPRLRPISESSALRTHTDRPHKLQSTNGGSPSDNEGPVVISLKSGRQLEPPSKVPGSRRNPSDKLPEPPKQRPELEGFALRKSHSSECLDKDSGEDEYPSTRGGRRSSCVERGRSNHVYETLVGREGYARPLKLTRAPDMDHGHGAKEKNSTEGDQPGGALYNHHRLGPSPSEGAFAPVLTPTATPVTDQDVEKVPGKKMNLVRQKINQAYEVLHTVFNEPRPRSVSEEEEDQETGDQPTHSEDTGDSDGTVDVKEIKRRVTYCSTVRLKTSQSIQKSREFLDKIYPQLFEYALIVGLRTRTDQQGYDSYVIHKFPPSLNSDVSVPKFCFPDAAEFRPGSATAVSESYSFVLTNIDGGRRFGYCRRIQPRDSSLPEVICIVSPVDAFNMYNKLLSEVEGRRHKSLEHAQELILASFGRPLPSPGKVCSIQFLDESGQMDTIFMDRPLDQRLTNVNYESLLQYLGTNKLIKVFSSMLVERRLILCSHHLSILTQTIHALVALLYPFQWQHVYIPLLPPDMLEVCAAPMPFIIGILHSHLERVTTLELEDVIIVDLDKKHMVRCVGDELTLLPKKVQKALKTALNMCKVDSDAVNSQWLMVSEAFLRMFIEMMGHFPHYIATQQDGNKTFMKEQFVSGVASKGIRQFLEWFTETQMFEVFMCTQLERQTWGSMDLFMKRLGELQSKRQSNGPQSKGLGKKVKDLGKAIKTKWK